MSTSKRSAEDITRPASSSGGAGVDVVLSGGSTASASVSGSKRVKTAASATASPPANNADPIQSVLTNPDTLSKALLCLDAQDVPAAARTCKVWNETLESIQDKLWLGLVREHHPTLETIRSMLRDDDGDGSGSVPCKSWKNLFKRRRTITSGEGGALPPGIYPRALGSYFFEVIFVPSIGEKLATVVESASLVCAWQGDDAAALLKLAPVEKLEGGAFSVSIRVYDKETGRQALLLDRLSLQASPGRPTGSYHGSQAVYHDIQQMLSSVMCVARATLIRECDETALTVALHALLYIHRHDDDVAPAPSSVINNGVQLGQCQLLDFLEQQLNWS